MKKIKIFPKMFIQIFSVLGIIIILVHSLVFFIFPKTYLETRKEKIHNMANEISSNMNGKEIKYIEQTLELYSKSSEIKAFIKEENNKNEIQIKDNINVNLESDSNSLIIEEREIKLNDGKKINLQFVSTADMQKDAKDLSIKFLPYSLFISILFSAIISLIYAKLIKNNLQEIKIVTDKMMELDKETRLKVNSNDEVGELKQQINDLYSTLLRTIDDLEFKNKEIIKLEKLKYDFFKGASHELKTPLASLKIILENMKYNIGKYAYSADKWKDGHIPESYQIQCHHYMAVTGAKAWYIAVVILGREFLWQRIERDEELIQNLISIEKDFWQNHVIPQIMPEPDGSSSSEELIQQYFGKAQFDKVIPLTGFDEQLKRRNEIAELMDKLDTEKKTIEQKIKVFMQDAEVAENDHYRISWKNSTSNRIDTTRLKAEMPDVYTHFCKPTQSRRFLVKAVS